MDTNNEDNMKLIYVMKNGYNSKNQGLFEFIFSTDESNIDIEGWSWDMIPACDYALPPDEDHISITVNLKTSTFDLFCLHEAVDRPYMHGVHTIHALAYEIELMNESGYSQYEALMSDDETPLLVFHYGMTLTKVKELLLTKKMILKNSTFIETSSIQF